MSSWCFIFMLWLPQEFWKSDSVLISFFLTSFPPPSANYDRDGLQGLLTISLMMCESCHCPLGALTVTERCMSWLLSVFNSSMPFSVISHTLRRVILSSYVCSWQLPVSVWLKFHMCTCVCTCVAGAVDCVVLLIVFAVCMPGVKWHW